MGTLELETIKNYLLKIGYKIEYQYLVHDFKQFLCNPDPQLQAQIRNQFKDYVNRLATVSIEDGKKFIILRSEFRPPKPPPRRHQSTRSTYDQVPAPVEKLREIHDLTKKSPGRVKEHTTKLNSIASNIDLRHLMPRTNSQTSITSVKENNNCNGFSNGNQNNYHYVNRAIVQRSASHSISRSRSISNNNNNNSSSSGGSSKKDDSDSGSLQPLDPIRRKWMIDACKCDYNGLLTLLREDPKLASYKDFSNGYTALHWAAKFGNTDIIKLIAGAYGVSTNIRSHGGYTPLHLATMFNRAEVMDLLIKTYHADPNIRDHNGRKPIHYLQAKITRHTLKLTY